MGSTRGAGGGECPAGASGFLRGWAPPKRHRIPVASFPRRAMNDRDKTNEQLIEELLRCRQVIARLEAAGPALRESEERFRQVAEHVREVFWLADAHTGKAVYISPAYEEIWGRSCQSLYESPDSWLEAVHPEDRPRVEQETRDIARRGGAHQQYRIVRPDGSVRWVRDRAFAIRDDRGEVYRLVGIAEDVTERQRAEEAR